MGTGQLSGSGLLSAPLPSSSSPLYLLTGATTAQETSIGRELNTL